MSEWIWGTNYHRQFSTYADIFLLVSFFMANVFENFAILKTRYKFSSAVYENFYYVSFFYVTYENWHWVSCFVESNLVFNSDAAPNYNHEFGQHRSAQPHLRKTHFVAG